MNNYEPVPDFVTPLQEKHKSELEEYFQKIKLEPNEQSGMYGVVGFAHALRFRCREIEKDNEGEEE